MARKTIEEQALADQLALEMLGRIADKWTLLALDVLGESNTPMRFSRLQEAMSGVSQKMLTKTLRRLERDGLVIRQVYAEVPPRVDYTLTPLGHNLAEAACGIWLWVEKHAGDVAKARQRFDGKAKVLSSVALR